MAGCSDIAACRGAAVLGCNQMLSSAFKRLGLFEGDALFRSIVLRVALPHGQLAVIAAAGLLFEGGISEAYKSTGHV